MAVLTLNSTRLCTLGLGVALFLAAPALAGDVSLKLDTGSGFSIKNSTGAVERLRVDEATGNVSRNGALFVHTTGVQNLFVGPGAGNTATNFSVSDSAFGVNALSANTTGSDDSAFGSSALRANTTGSSNSAFGVAALFYNTMGNYNSAFGVSALHSNTTGFSNSAVGTFALISNTTGNRNTAFGYGAMTYNTTGRSNSAVGYGALRLNTTGHRNIAIGQYAGQLQTIGHDNIYLANAGAAAESGQIKIGTVGTHTAAFVAGIRNVTTANADGVPVLIDSAGQLGTVSSSRTAKKEIRDMGDATSRLLGLRPVTFRYKQPQTLPSGREVPPEYGLVAEEVAEVLPDLVVYDEKGQPFTVKYHEMAPMLLNEMKKQQKTIEAQASLIAAGQEESRAQQAEIATLTARLARVESREAR